MKHEQSFAVSRFENRNGVTSWRVDGRLHGVRIRRNFKTQEEAAAEKAALEMKAMQSASGMQSVTTFLAADQFREAEAVFRRLAGRPRPLSFYVEFALANYREPVTQKLLTEAVTAYVATKQHEHEQDLLSEPHLTRMKRDLKRLEKHFPGATVAELTGARLVGYFEARKAALKTYNTCLSRRRGTARPRLLLTAPTLLASPARRPSATLRFKPRHPREISSSTAPNSYPRCRSRQPTRSLSARSPLQPRA